MLLHYELKDLSLIDRTFYDLNPGAISLFNEIPESVIHISVEIVDKAKSYSQMNLSDSFVFTLADHLHFATIIMAKTKTQITLPMPVDVGNAIYAYLCNGRPASNDQHIFIRTKAPYGKLTGKVCTKALYRILPEREAVKGGGFHVTRRTFATNLLRNQAEIDAVMDALGHRDPTSVMKYLLLDEERSKSCALSLSMPGFQ